jgi:hypothetical protein
MATALVARLPPAAAAEALRPTTCQQLAMTLPEDQTPFEPGPRPAPSPRGPPPPLDPDDPPRPPEYPNPLRCWHTLWQVPPLPADPRWMRGNFFGMRIPGLPSVRGGAADPSALSRRVI